MARRKENDAIFRLKSKHSCPHGMFGKYLAHCRIGLAWQVNRTNIPGYSMYFYSRTRSVKRTVNLNSWPAVSRPICFAGVYWFLTAFRLRSGFCNKMSLPVVARACIVVFLLFAFLDRPFGKTTTSRSTNNILESALFHVVSTYSASSEAAIHESGFHSCFDAGASPYAADMI